MFYQKSTFFFYAPNSCFNSVGFFSTGQVSSCLLLGMERERGGGN